MRVSAPESQEHYIEQNYTWDKARLDETCKKNKFMAQGMHR